MENSKHLGVLSRELTAAYFFEDTDSLPFSEVFRKDDLITNALKRTGAFFEKIRENKIEGQIEQGVLIDDRDGPVLIGLGSTIHSGAVLVGPVFIGRNCSVRYQALVRNRSIIGDGCVIGHCAEIKASICLPGSKAQSKVFVGDSILGRSARLGSGTILANRRFDQKDVKIRFNNDTHLTGLEFVGCVLGDYSRLGANVVTSPGTLVGRHVWVYSLVNLEGFVESNKLVRPKKDFTQLEYINKEPLTLRSGIGEYEWI